MLRRLWPVLQPLLRRRPFEDGMAEEMRFHIEQYTDDLVRSVIGRRIRVNGRARTVVGVLPPDFRFLSSRARLYFPLSSDPEEHAPNQRHSGNSDMIGRLGPGTALAEAQSQIDAHNGVMEADSPQARMMAGAGFLVADDSRRPVLGAVSLFASLLPSERAARISPMEALAED